MLVADQYKDQKKEWIYQTIQVKDKKAIPFTATLTTADKDIFVYQKAFLTL